MAQTIPCPACGTDNSPDAVRCHVCDYELRGQLPGPPSSGPSKCPRCGSGVAGGAAYCQVCGQAVDQRFARPHTGALNVAALFGDDENVPQRTPIREHTEIAPSARDDDFAPLGHHGGHQKLPVSNATIRGHARQSPAPRAGEIQTPEPSAPRGRRRAAPRPRPVYAGFDAGDSGQGDVDSSPQSHAVIAGQSFAPVYADGPTSTHPPPRPQSNPDPGASANNLPRPRFHSEAEAAPIAKRRARKKRTGHGYEDASVGSAQRYGGPPTSSWTSPQPTLSTLRLVLVGRDGREGESFPIPSMGVEIGRSATIAFPSDPFVSPIHAKVTPIDGGIHLGDLGSRNGIYLRLTEAAAVYPGDHFLLGNQLLRLDQLDTTWQEKPLDQHEVRGFGTPVKPPWAALTRVCVGEIEDDRYHLRGTEVTIGREQGEIVFPSDGFLSRAHARVRMEVQDNTMIVLLEDLGSANGTYLRIRGAVNVPHGSMFRVGDQIFRVRHD